MPSFSSRPRRDTPTGGDATDLSAYTLLRLAGLLTEAAPLNDILRRAAALIPSMLPVKIAMIFRTEPAGGADRLVADGGDDDTVARLSAWLEQPGAELSSSLLSCDEVDTLSAPLDALGFAVIDRSSAEAPFQRDLFDALEVERLLALPLRHGESRVGLLLLGARDTHDFDAGEIGLARGIADQLSLAVSTSRLREESARRTRELAALHSAALATGGALDDASALRTICDQAARAFDADLAAIYLLEDQRYLRGAYLGGESFTEAEVARWQLLRIPVDDQSFLAELWRAGGITVVRDRDALSLAYAPLFHRLGLNSLLSVPLRAEGAPIGMLLVGDRRAGLFSNADLPLAEALVEHAAAAISRGRAYMETEGAREHVRRQLDFTLAITDNLSGGLCAVDRSGRITFANPAAERLLGRPTDDLLDRHLHEVLHDGCSTIPHEGAADCPMLEPLISGQVMRVDEDSFCRREGDPMPVAYTSSAIVTLGEIDGAVLSFTDMTARKAAEAALQASEQRYREVVENAADMIHATDVAGNYSFANPTAVLSTGYTLEEYRKMNYLDLILPEHQFRVRTHYTRQYLGREPVTLVEFPYRTKSGEVRWVAQSASLRFEGGKITGFNLIGRDITDRKRIEEELERSAQQNLAQKTELEGIITHLADGLMLADSYGRVTLVNPVACELLGISPDDAATSRPEAEYWHAITSEGKAMAVDDLPLARALQGERLPARELTVVVDDETRVLSVSGSPLWTPEGALHGAVAVLRDVTEMQRTQERFVQNERLRAVGEMASGVAHDFNNLLAVILGRCELLLDDPKTQHRDDLQIVKQAAMDGAETVKRLQAMSGVRRSSPVGEIELAAIFRDIVEFTRPRWKDAAQQRGVTIEIETAMAPLPPLQGSPAELREVLVNLVFNAVDAMPEGGMILIAAGRRGDEVWIQVADTGAGMSEEVQQRIFEPFFTTKGTRGAGLGLSMSYGIIDRMGGRIEVESAPNAGTTFTILLPYHPAVATAAAPARSPIPSLSVLLIDDEAQVLDTTRKMLERDGHRVTPAESGGEALTLLAEDITGDAFDVVLTDLGMPGMNGLQLVAAVRAAGLAVPCILATGWGMELTADQVRAAGADEMLAKPFSAADLRAALAAVVGGARAPIQS